MFGFACDETPELMPATLFYSHKILERMAADRHSGAAPFLEPDAKSQVTLRFENGKPAAATAIVVSTQHKRGYSETGEHADPKLYAELRDYVKGVVADVLPAELLNDDTVYHINPTGAFEIGGPDGDAGLTGRKIIVDTYGGAAPHGGGAFSGKDPTKVDRSAAYVARYLAKNIVAAGLARRCTIQLAYAIGVSEPLSLYVDTHGTGSVGDDQLEAAIGRIEKLGGLTPRGIRTHLGLNKPIYASDRRLRPFRPQGRRRLVPVGKDRPRRRFEGRARSLAVIARQVEPAATLCCSQPRRCAKSAEAAAIFTRPASQTRAAWRRIARGWRASSYARQHRRISRPERRWPARKRSSAKPAICYGMTGTHFWLLSKQASGAGSSSATRLRCRLPRAPRARRLARHPARRPRLLLPGLALERREHALNRFEYEGKSCCRRSAEQCSLAGPRLRASVAP